jgi:hypothetical protein
MSALSTVPQADLPTTSDRRHAQPRPGSVVAWTPPENMEHRDWVLVGRRLGAIGRVSQWWVGDWIHYGNSKWGEKYTEAARITGYDVASLRNMASVASRFDVSLRNDKLTWSHHVLLAPLEPDEQRYWLDRARQERLSVNDLRIELRSAGRNSKPAIAHHTDAVAPVGAQRLICPHCGGEVPIPPTRPGD